MPMRFRKSVKIAPGVRVNVGKKGVSSVSFGGKYGRTNVSSRGVSRSVSVPGTGMSFYSGTSTSSRSSAARQPAAAPAPPKPGLLAPAWEKRLYEGFQAFQQGDLATARAKLSEVSTLQPHMPSPWLFGAIAAARQGDLATAGPWLEWVVQNAQLPDVFMAKYAPGASLTVPVTERVSVDAPLDSVAAPLLLAELYQRTGRREEAIGLIQQIYEANPSDMAIRLSLADLLFEDDDNEGVIDVAAGIGNDSDVALALIHLRAKALLRSGLSDAALTELTTALKKTSGRDPALLREIRYDRAVAYEELGQKGKARADWGKLYAEDPNYRDVRERVQAQQH